MLDRLPYEVCLQIFTRVFEATGCYAVLHVRRSSNGKPCFTLTKSYESTRSCLLGPLAMLQKQFSWGAVAAAAIEAACRARFDFAIDAEYLPEFLLTSGAVPQRFIKRIRLYMEEDPHFVGDGPQNDKLRAVDYVDIFEPHLIPKRLSRSVTGRTGLMRRCWRALLGMQQLEWILFRVMPAGGKLGAADIKQWEIRDLLPMFLHLTAHSVRVRLSLRIWEIETQEEREDCPNVVWSDRWIDTKTCDSDGRHERAIDLTRCLPSLRRPDERTLMEIVELSRAKRSKSVWAVSTRDREPVWNVHHEVNNTGLVFELMRRLVRNKNYERVDDVFRRVNKKRGCVHAELEEGLHARSLLTKRQIM